MNEIEFINYIPTPEEKYFIGIATVRLYGKIVLRYKAIMKKDGTGYFIAPATYRIPNSSGEFEYLDAVSVDSKLESEALMNLIRKNVDACLQPAQAQQTQQSIQPQAQQQQYQAAPPQQEKQLSFGECPF